jgi:hypothetical protein
MYFDRNGITLRGGLMVDDEGDVEDLKGLMSVLWSCQCVCIGSICVWMLLSYMSWDGTLIIGNSEK